MKNHENEYWLLEQWGLWSQPKSYPRGYRPAEISPIKERWEIEEQMAQAVEDTVRAMHFLDKRIIRRWFVDTDYDVKQDLLQISINRFAVAFGLADESQVCVTYESSPRKIIARRKPGPWLHPDRNVRKVLCWLPKRPKITMEWLKTANNL